MDLFFSDADRTTYLALLAKYAERYGVAFLAWCLMANHVHLIAVPKSELSLARCLGEAHRRYTRMINFRHGCRGYLFQGRFHSCPLDGQHLLAAVRYVLRNPVRAGIVEHAWDYVWSSARSMARVVPQDPLARESELLADITDWKEFLECSSDDLSPIRKHTCTGRPLGSDAFLGHVESVTGRVVRPNKPGPKRAR